MLLQLIGKLIEPRSPKLLAWGEVAEVRDLDTADDTFAIAAVAEIPWLIRYQVTTTRITKKKVTDAFRNLGNGLKLMEGLLQEENISIDKEAILELVKTGNEKIVKFLLDNNHTGDMTSEEITLAAVPIRLIALP